VTTIVADGRGGHVDDHVFATRLDVPAGPVVESALR
jgi:hypothetical protein